MLKSKFPHRTSVVFSSEMYEMLKQIAEDEEKSIGEVIRKKLERALNKRKPVSK